jgi:hypothetical protein
MISYKGSGSKEVEMACFKILLHQMAIRILDESENYVQDSCLSGPDSNPRLPHYDVAMTA